MAAADTAATTDLLSAFVDRLISGAQSDMMKTIVDTEFSFTQFQTLLLLHCCDTALPIHRIAEQLGLSVAAAGRGVDKLVQLGFVDRREDEHDRRIKRVSLNVSGRKLVADQFAIVHDRNREFVTRLPDALRCQLSRTLGQILLGGYLGPFPTDCGTAQLFPEGSE
ncbi:MAG TPA: MarR family transcriptional regulator [Pseudonocardiaceae bacterium]|nr:MarR family transcriptional regulator [Pseudonocardiaceae bacterium]